MVNSVIIGCDKSQQSHKNAFASVGFVLTGQEWDAEFCRLPILILFCILI